MHRGDCILASSERNTSMLCCLVHERSWSDPTYVGLPSAVRWCREHIPEALLQLQDLASSLSQIAPTARLMMEQKQCVASTSMGIHEKQLITINTREDGGIGHR